MGASPSTPHITTILYVIPLSTHCNLLPGFLHCVQSAHVCLLPVIHCIDKVPILSSHVFTCFVFSFL